MSNHSIEKTASRMFYKVMKEGDKHEERNKTQGGFLFIGEVRKNLLILDH